MDANLPPVSVLIPALNEAGYIKQCIESIISGSYPSEKLEVLVIDGGSADDTIPCARMADLKSASLRIVRNQKKIVPAAMNIGLAEATNEVIIWVGAHAIYSSRYIETLVTTLTKRNCGSVGGLLLPRGETLIGKSIAAATSSKFGIGNAKYRFAKDVCEVETVFGGCWYRSDIIKIGGFNENWVRNQDFELNTRIRKLIGPLVLNPAAQCHYFCRQSFKSLAKQYFQYGYWRWKTVLTHRDTFSARYAAPPFLLLSLFMSLVMALAGLKFWFWVPSFYLATLLAHSVFLTVRHKNLFFLILLPVTLMIVHLTWATGFYSGFFNSLFSSKQRDLTKL